FKALAFKKQTPETEKLYMASFNCAFDLYRQLLAEVGRGRLTVPNDNFDVGEPTRAGKYKLADEAYAKLLQKLEGHYAEMSKDLRSNILAFYQDLSAPIATKANETEWAKLQEQLVLLDYANQDLSVTGASVTG